MDDNERRAAAKLWALGDYARIAAQLRPAADLIARSVGDGHGRRALDLATGTGSVARALADVGWAVTGTDLCVPLLDVGRAEAAGDGLVIEWREAPLDAIPFDDASFQLVTSSFGLIFSGDATATLREAARVLLPGGQLVFTAWTPEGYVGQMSSLIAGFTSPATSDAPGPFSWGEPATLRDRLAADFIDVDFAPRTLSWVFDNAEAAVDLFFTHSPGHLAALEAVGEGRAVELKDAVRDHLRQHAAPSGRVDVAAEYLLVSARRA